VGRRGKTKELQAIIACIMGGKRVKQLILLSAEMLMQGGHSEFDL
jgi:hypothetical protein